MAGPLGAEAVYSLVDSLQRSDVVVRQFVPYGHDEVDIAMGIKVTNRKGPLQVGTDKRITQSTLNAGDQVLEDRIEFRVLCPVIHDPRGLTR